MPHSAFRYVVSVTFLGVLLSAAFAQDKKPAAEPEPVKKGALQKAEDEYRQFFKKPETALEFWAAMNFEIGVGKFALAAEDLKGFLAKNPSKDDLLQIEGQEGMSAFLRLLTIPELRADGQKLLDQVTQVVKEHRGDPERIKRFVSNLRASDEERAYALGQLRKSGAAAVPYLIEALRGSTERVDRLPILSALESLGTAVVPPLLAALDMDDAGLKNELIDVLQRRRDRAAIPGLWYLSASPKQPAMIRTKAVQTLLLLLGLERPEQLPAAPAALTREAEHYYQHQVSFANPPAVTVWEWQNNQLGNRTLTASQAEEYFGLRYAGQALDLDPGYEPSQIVFVSLALEKGVERSGFDHPLEKGALPVKDLVRVVNPGLLVAVLERALTDHRTPVILGAAQTLGDLGAVGALRPAGQRESPLLRALNYPDRRVQLTAADAVLRIPADGRYRVSSRVVEVLRRAAAADSKPRVLVASANKERGEELAKALQAGGYATELRATATDVLKRLAEAADVDALVIRVDAGQRLIPPNPSPPSQPRTTGQVIAPTDPIRFALPGPGLPDLLAQIRADVNYGYVPIFILIGKDQAGQAPAEFEVGLRRLAERYRNVWVASATTDQEYLKKEIETGIARASERPLSEAERKDDAVEAMRWLKRLAVGEVPGYDVRPAAGTILNGLKNPDLALFAIEAAGHLPGAVPQRELARVVLGDMPMPIRAAAALELARHVQTHGLTLTGELSRIQDLYNTTQDAKLKGNLALVLGSLHPDARQTGTRLQQFRPSFAPPAAPPPAKEK